MEQSHAILLRRYKFSENSLVVIWFTERHGKVKTAVRGATKPGSPFAGRLELFTEAEIAFKAPKSGDLHALSEVVMAPDAALPATYPTILAASYFAELCDLITEPMHPVPEIYRLLARAWGYLRRRNPDMRGVEHFETELAKVLGIHDPSLPAHRSLASVLGRIPESRGRLLAVTGQGGKQVQ
jgi:DNA repair protein RecO (recombination protein O)